MHIQQRSARTATLEQFARRASLPTETSAREERFACVVVDQDVAVSKGDQADAVAERGMGGEVSVMPSGLVVVRDDEDVDESQAGQVEFWRRCRTSPLLRVEELQPPSRDLLYDIADIL